MTFSPYTARKVIIGKTMTIWRQVSPDEYEVAHYKRVRGPWSSDYIWTLDGERERKQGRAPHDDKPAQPGRPSVSPPVVESARPEDSAEYAPPGRDEPWREKQRADEEWYWRKKTLRGET